MNYIEQIKGFWITQEVNQLGACEIAMYFHLLEIWNKTGWTGTFNRNNYKIMADLSIKSYKTLQGIRDRLQDAGILEFRQKNGDANVVYKLADLSKIYQGSGKGLGKVRAKVWERFGKGSGEVNINETKPNETKHSKSHSPPNGGDEKKELPYWKKFVDEWHKQYELLMNEKYLFMAKDFANLKRIYKFLESRARSKNFVFNEENLLKSFTFFIQKAWEKDLWLRENFSISNCLAKFNEITNGQQNYKNGKQPTGANVSTGSILTKIAGMPD